MTAIYQAPRNEAELISSPPGILKFRGMCDSLSVSRIQGGALRPTRTCPVPRSWACANKRRPVRVDCFCMLGRLVRGETGWAPLLSSCVWTNVSLSNKIHRYSKGLKVTECMCSWSKLRTKGTKRQNSPTATSEESGTKAGPCACPLHSAPPKGQALLKSQEQKQGPAHARCTQHPKGAGGPSKTPSSSPLDTPTPSLQGSSSPLLGE